MKLLVQALVDVILYLEMADDEEVSPEAATEAYDVIIASLYRLESQEKEELVAAIREIAASERNPERAELVANLPAGLGLLLE